MNEEEQYNVETSYTSPALNAAESLDQQIIRVNKLDK